MSERINVLKTYKNYVGGQFVRSESGHTYPSVTKNGKKLAQVCRSTRKDVRDAVTAARSAQPGWASKTAFNRGQIMYRLAEMLESQRAHFIGELTLSGMSRRQATKETDASVDRFVYYAGWTDKYSQVFGSVNPVASPYFNFSNPEPVGVTAVFCHEKSPLLGTVTAVACTIAGGNSTIVIPSENFPLPALSLGEVIHASDVPAGVVNILSGYHEELIDPLASHMDVNGLLSFKSHSDVQKRLDEHASENIKRNHHKDWEDGYEDSLESPYLMMEFMEIKTTWHPVGY